jgi:peptidoglycan/xylan/chitin deacetylase (PgdA/CDA1 family)
VLTGTTQRPRWPHRPRPVEDAGEAARNRRHFDADSPRPLGSCKVVSHRSRSRRPQNHEPTQDRVLIEVHILGTVRRSGRNACSRLWVHLNGWFGCRVPTCKQSADALASTAARRQIRSYLQSFRRPEWTQRVSFHLPKVGDQCSASLRRQMSRSFRQFRDHVPIRVLCYHSVSDLEGAPLIEQYGVPAHWLRRHVRTLRWFGFRFVTLDQVLASVDGLARLPGRPVLVTFDDGFADLLEAGLPVLQRERVPAVAFVVAGLAGETNKWDSSRGAPELRLMDESGLHALKSAGIDIGVHSMTHPHLGAATDHELAEEIVGATVVLEESGLEPQVFAYPFGDHDERVERQVAAAGLRAAFTSRSGLVEMHTQNLYQLPRILVLRRDGYGVRFLAKVIRAGRTPPAVRATISRLKRMKSIGPSHSRRSSE